MKEKNKKILKGLEVSALCLCGGLMFAGCNDNPNEVSNYTISYDYNLGDYLSNYNNYYFSNSIKVECGKCIELPNVEVEFQELDKYFRGWYTGDSVYDIKYSNHTPVFEDIKLYARWDEELLQNDLFATEGLKIYPTSVEGISVQVGYEGNESNVFVPRLVKSLNNSRFNKIGSIGFNDNSSKEIIKSLNLTTDNYIATITEGSFNNGVLEEINGDLNQLEFISNVFINTPYISEGIENSENQIFMDKGIVLDGTKTCLAEINIDGVRLIAANAFKNNTNITKVTFNETSKLDIKRIEDNAFYGCSNLVEIKSFGDVEDIDNYAFESCTKLEKVGLNVTDYMGIQVFKNTALKNFIVSESVVQWSILENSSGPFANDGNLVGITLIIDSQMFINRMFDSLVGVKILMEGIDIVVVNSSINIPEKSILNNSSYFTKNDNVYTYIYEA